MSHVEIYADKNPGNTRVLLDGQLLGGLQSVRFEQGLEGTPKVTLVLRPLQVTLLGKDCEVAMYKPEKQA